MSRSYKTRANLSGKLGPEMILEMLRPACRAATTSGVEADVYRCDACGQWRHDDPLSDKSVPGSAVVVALVRRRWPPKAAKRFVEYETLGKRYGHVPRDYDHPMSRRGWRRSSKILVDQDRADEIAPWRYDRGRNFW
jgi:hypothetical protein